MEEHPGERVERAIKNVRDTVFVALEYTEAKRALVVYDTESALSCLLYRAYREVVPNALFIDFNTTTKENILAHMHALMPKDLVVLIQTTDFRLNAFRIRIQLFQQKLKVIDHLHLYRTRPDMIDTYIDALAYDAEWYRGVGHAIKERISRTQTLRICSNETELVVTGGLESPKPNLGDYTQMENVGGTFPIGEIFTEANILEQVNGSLLIYAFADATFQIAMHEPFRIEIENGLVTHYDTRTPQTFISLIEQIRMSERPIIREIGFGLNRAITRKHPLADITAFERMLGLHVSMGEKHTVYKKVGITADKTRYHVDLFPVTENVYADDVLLFANDTYCV